MEIIRGDSQLFKIKIIDSENKPLKIEDVETIILTTRKKPSKFSSILFKKKLSDMELDEDGFLHIEFKPTDTEKLNYGEYYFDIEITLKDGYRKSRVYKFNLLEETTIHNDSEV